MLYVSEGQWLLCGGIAVMSVSAVLSAAVMIIFTLTGRRIKKKLEQEYGKPGR